jgi:hypothetical protein
MIITNKMNLPEGLVKAVEPGRHNKPGCISATTLLNGTKQVILTERHWDRIEEDVSDRFWAIFGTAVHALLEHEGAHDFTEETMAFDMDGVSVTGRIDNFNMETATVTDYKTASVWKVIFKSFEEWRRQGLIYAWLLTKNGFKVERCRFVALLKDHSKTEALRMAAYPRGPVYVYEFPVTGHELREIELFIEEKVAAYKRDMELGDDEIPPCSPDERWERPSKYAVMKHGRKSAVRVMDTMEEAAKLAGDLGKGHYVETRPGESVRCQGYCSCREFCDFYRDQVKQPDPEEEVKNAG